MADAQGPPLRFALTGGKRPDVARAIPLLTGIETRRSSLTKGYGSNPVLAFIRDQGPDSQSGHTAQSQPPGTLGIRPGTV